MSQAPATPKQRHQVHDDSFNIHHLAHRPGMRQCGGGIHNQCRVCVWLARVLNTSTMQQSAADLGNNFSGMALCIGTSSTLTSTNIFPSRPNSLLVLEGY